MNVPRIYRGKLLLALLAFGAIVGYGLFEARTYLTGPTLSLSVPPNTSSSMLIIAGVAGSATELTINGEKVSTDQHGAFSHTTVLAPGYNMLTALAKDRFGTVREKNMEVVYTPSRTSSVQPPANIISTSTDNGDTSFASTTLTEQ